MCTEKGYPLRSAPFSLKLHRGLLHPGTLSVREAGRLRVSGNGRVADAVGIGSTVSHCCVDCPLPCSPQQSKDWSTI